MAKFDALGFPCVVLQDEPFNVKIAMSNKFFEAGGTCSAMYENVEDTLPRARCPLPVIYGRAGRACGRKLQMERKHVWGGKFYCDMWCGELSRGYMWCDVKLNLTYSKLSRPKLL